MVKLKTSNAFLYKNWTLSLCNNFIFFVIVEFTCRGYEAMILFTISLLEMYFDQVFVDIINFASIANENTARVMKNA